MVYVTDGADVDVRLGTLECLLCHVCRSLVVLIQFSSSKCCTSRPGCPGYSSAFYREPLTGIEPVTSSLPRKCSTPELQRPSKFAPLLGGKGIGGAGDETRTRDVQLGRLMLYQLSYSRIGAGLGPSSCIGGPFLLRERTVPNEWWGEQDSNLRSCEAADLQSAPVGHLGISPEAFGANGGTRTHDLLITSQLLYQLSYIGLYNKKKNEWSSPFPDQGPELGLQM
jgi:hypothetical protein